MMKKGDEPDGSNRSEGESRENEALRSGTEFFQNDGNSGEALNAALQSYVSNSARHGSVGSDRMLSTNQRTHPIFWNRLGMNPYLQNFPNSDSRLLPYDDSLSSNLRLSFHLMQEERQRQQHQQQQNLLVQAVASGLQGDPSVTSSLAGLIGARNTESDTNVALRSERRLDGSFLEQNEAQASNSSKRSSQNTDAFRSRKEARREAKPSLNREMLTQGTFDNLSETLGRTREVIGTQPRSYGQHTHSLTSEHFFEPQNLQQVSSLDNHLYNSSVFQLQPRDFLNQQVLASSMSNRLSNVYAGAIHPPVRASNNYLQDTQQFLNLQARLLGSLSSGHSTPPMELYPRQVDERSNLSMADRALPLTTQHEGKPAQAIPRKKILGDLSEIAEARKRKRSFDNVKVVPMHIKDDENNISPYQCLLRKQIKVFEADLSEAGLSTQGRSRPILPGQVGIRCRHCLHGGLEKRTTGSVYYPNRLDGVYQTAQKMASSHFFNHCKNIPPDILNELKRLKDFPKSLDGSGKRYWAEAMHMLGVIETEEEGLVFSIE